MVVIIEFLGRQRMVTKTARLDMPVTAKTRVTDALKYVRDRYPALHLDEGTVLITVNQQIATGDRILKANDAVSFLPYISGG